MSAGADRKKKGMDKSMNKLYRKAAAVITAGVMTATSFCTECFAANQTAAASGSVTAAYGATAVAKPTYTIKGTKGVRKVMLKTATPGATIYYTVNGSTPTANSYKYVDGTLLKITSDVKFKAVAIKDGVSSDVMTKTVKVATLVGDVTGDGRVNNNDYKRFNSYAKGTSTFACWDNLDCDGNGTVTTKDIRVLLQYLNSEISALPYTGVEAEDPEGADDASGGSSTSGSPSSGSSTSGSSSSGGSSSGSSSSGSLSTTLPSPGITVYRSYGGKKVEFSSSVNGGTFYYTTDGSAPTTSSAKYSGAFIVDKSCTVKVIVVRGSEASKAQEISITVGSTGSISTSKDTSKVYSGSTNIDLICDTADSIIYYTTDGSDPAASNTAILYNGPFTITKTTVVKAFAQAKGCANSKTSTFKFSFGNDYTISGTIFADANANGVKDTGESGISGISVYAYNVDKKAYEKTVKTDSSGNYTFTGLTKDAKYQAVAEYNIQKYRPIKSAYLKASLPALTMRNNGAYDTTGNKFSTANSLAEALKGDFYVATSYTGETYTETAVNCDFALVPMDNSYLSLSVNAIGANVKNEVMNGDSITYEVILTNNSPTQTLSAVTIGFYFTSGVYKQFSFGGLTYDEDDSRAGYRYYYIKDLIGSAGLAPGKSVSFKYTATLDGVIGDRIRCYAEVVNYRFENSLYDCYSIPGNLNVGGSLSQGEKDEAEAAVLTITKDSGGSSDARIVYNGNKNYELYQGEVVELEITLQNVTSNRDYAYDYTGEPSYTVCELRETNNGSSITLRFKITANTAGNSGTSTLTLKLKNNSSESLRVKINVMRGRRGS